MLAPNLRNTEGVLARLLDTQLTTTGWCHAVLDTELNALKTTPDWYADIEKSLGNAKGDARSWVQDLGPAVSASVPQGLIDFADRFEATIKPLQKLVSTVMAQPDCAPTADQKEQFRQLISGLSDISAKRLDEVREHDKRYLSFQDHLGTSIDELRTEANKVAKALALEEAKIADLQRTIRDIQAEIVLVGDRISREQISSPSSITTTTVGAVVKVASFVVAGGTASSVFGLGMALFTIGKGVVIGAIYEGQLRDDIRRLYKVLDEWGEERIEAIGLQVLDTSLRSLFDSAEAANDQLPYMQTVWTEVALRLETVRVALAQPEVDLSTIDELQHLDEAAKAWKQIATYAQNFQQIYVDHQTQAPIEIPTREDAIRWSKDS